MYTSHAIYYILYIVYYILYIIYYISYIIYYILYTSTQPPYGGVSGVCVYSLALGPCGPRPRDSGQEFMTASQVQTHTHMRSQKTLKSDRGLNLEPRMTSKIHKPMENLMFLEVQLSKVFKILVFLKVRTLNFDRGLSFEIAKRSSPIGVSI